MPGFVFVWRPQNRKKKEKAQKNKIKNKKRNESKTKTQTQTSGGELSCVWGLVGDSNGSPARRSVEQIMVRSHKCLLAAKVVVLEVVVLVGSLHSHQCHNNLTAEMYALCNASGLASRDECCALV